MFKQHLRIERGGTFISHAAMAVIVALLIVAAVISLRVRATGECKRKYVVEKVMPGLEVEQVKRQFVSQGWDLESEDTKSDRLYVLLTFSRCEDK